MTSSDDRQIAIIVLCGPTASGKTALACSLAESLDIEIVSADSRQVYRKMNIGTAKPTAADVARVPHHLIDIVDPDEDYSVADYVDDASKVIADIDARNKIPVIVGGTGLYIRSLTEGLAELPSADENLRQELHLYENKQGAGALHKRLQSVDPQRAVEIHPNNLVRIVRSLEVFELSGMTMSEYQQKHQFGEKTYRNLKLYLQWPREQLYARIDERVDQMLAAGLVEEVKALESAGYQQTLKSMQAIGYREVFSFLHGILDYAEAVELIKRESRRYAKRQETWFKKEKSIISVDSLSEIDRIQPLIERFLLQKGSGHGQNTI